MSLPLSTRSKFVRYSKDKPNGLWHGAFRICSCCCVSYSRLSPTPAPAVFTKTVLFCFYQHWAFSCFYYYFFFFFSRMHSRKCVQVVTLLITSTFESLFLLSNRSLNRYHHENIHSPKLSFVLLASKSSCKNVKEENLLSTVYAMFSAESNHIICCKTTL